MMFLGKIVQQTTKGYIKLKVAFNYINSYIKLYVLREHKEYNCELKIINKEYNF